VPKLMKKNIDAHIGSRLRLRRLMLGMSQEVLGEYLSITFQQVQKYEKGNNRISASTLYYIARILDVPVDYFYEGLPILENAYGPGMMEETTPSVTPYLSFVSSAEGLELNQAFVRIRSSSMRRSIISLVNEVANLAA